jgi:hypothetical protein
MEHMNPICVAVMATCTSVSSGLPCAPAADFAAAPAMLRLYSFVPLSKKSSKIARNSEKKILFYFPLFSQFLPSF